MIKRLSIFLVLLIVAMAIGMTYYVRDQLNAPLALDEPVIYQVSKGASIRRVLGDFEQRGWIEEARVPEFWLRYQQQTNIHQGEYRLKPGDTALDVAQRMVEGIKIQRSVKFIEGWNFAQIRSAMEVNEYLTPTLAELSGQEVLERLGLEVEHPEGWFFPDTYYFERGTTDADLLRRAYAKMVRELEQAWAERSDNAVVETPYEALVLASIVEKETGVPEERAQIAGVFSRRLEQGMRLQTDPTVIYGLGSDFDGNLTRTLLRRDTPYNSYTRTGLPPTPIASPGREALNAAVNPAPGSSLFFVARGDGSHVFSDTYEEHNAAVRHFQRFNRTDDYRSSPPPEENSTGESQ